MLLEKGQILNFDSFKFLKIVEKNKPIIWPEGAP